MESRVQTSFSTLKQCLVQSPVLTFPNVSSTAKLFVLQTDARSLEIEAVLEQTGKVVAYASCVLTKAEKSYSVIQQKCLMPSNSLAISFRAPVHLTN